MLSGAGLSTESGIPDYRGPDGTRRVEPMTYGEFAGSSEARRRYWARSFIGWQRFNAGADPTTDTASSPTCSASGYVGPVITQNVDGLHQAAGARDVVELHGSLDRAVCLTCGEVTTAPRAARADDRGQPRLHGALRGGGRRGGLAVG